MASGVALSLKKVGVVFPEAVLRTKRQSWASFPDEPDVVHGGYARTIRANPYEFFPGTKMGKRATDRWA